MVKTATGERESLASGVAKFFFSTVALTLLVATLGFGPTTRIGGEGAVTGLLTGCAVSLAGSWLGSVPVFVAIRGSRGRVQAALASMVLRFVLVAGTAVAVALTVPIAKGPFLIWVAISYATLLVVDVLLVVKCNLGSPVKQGKG